MWRVELHPNVANWLELVTEKEYERVMAALDALEADGPKLNKPFVDHIKGSKLKNLKELRPRGGYVRLLFAFDPKRTAFVMVAGDKSTDWNSWYQRNIPVAERRFTEHLKGLS